MKAVMTQQVAKELSARGSAEGYVITLAARRVLAAFLEGNTWSEENLTTQLREAVAFGFEAALDHRGDSAGRTHDVVLMWLLVLGDPLFSKHAGDELYDFYGLPLFKDAAVEYGFPNPIGLHTGNEDCYAEPPLLEH